MGGQQRWWYAPTVMRVLSIGLMAGIVAGVGLPGAWVTALTTTQVASAAAAGNPPTSSLSDDFTGSTLDTNKWQAGTNTTLPSPPVTVNNGLNIATSTGNGYSFITSKNVYSLRGSSVTTELLSAGDQTIASAQVFPMEVVTLAGLYASPGTDQGWQIEINQGSFAAVQRRDIYLGGWHPYDPAVDRYFRISESGGTIHFATSPDGVTWNEFYSYANPGVDIDNMVIRLTAGNWNTETRTTTAVFGNVNITPVPNAPTAVSATAAPNQATVSWSPPASNGTAPITSYTVSAADSTTPANGGQTCTYTVASPETDTCTVSGLTNGDSYTFTVTATNANGTGPASVASSPVTPSSATPPTTFVGIPSNGATITGSSWLDAGASSPVGIASVSFEVSGGSISDQVISSTPTLYGWLGAWNSTSVSNGTYTIQSVATDVDGVSTTSAPITVTVNNLPPSTTVLVPSDGATQSGTAAVLDASAPGATGVSFELSGGTLTNEVIATATLTLYGWIGEWNTTNVANGTYTLQSVATELGGTTVTSPPITITVSN